MCYEVFDVKAHKRCKTLKNEICTEWSITFNNSDIRRQVNHLEHQYYKSFGRYGCDFYISTFEPGNQNTEYLSWCYDSKLRRIAVDGLFFDGKNRFFAFFDRKSQKQQLAKMSLTEKEGQRSLHGTETFENDVITRGLKKKNPSFNWNDFNKTIYFDKPTVELAIVVDHYFITYMGEDKELIEMATHQIVNGVSAMYKHVGISVTHSGYLEIGSEDTSKLSKGVTDYPQYLTNLTEFYEAHVISESQDSKRKISTITGIPDMAITITNLKLEDVLLGRMLFDGMCSSIAKGVVIINDYYRYGTMIPRAAYVMAHEMAHSFGVPHVPSECTCELPRGLCIMNPAAAVARLSGQWTECSRGKFKSVVKKSAEERNCLFTKNVFTNEEVDRNPYRRAKVELVASFTGSELLTMSLQSQLFDHQSLDLHKSFDALLFDGHVCSFYHNKLGEQFAAFHWCGSTTNNSRWSGVFHLLDSQVEVNYDKRRGVYVAHRSSIVWGDISDLFLPNQGNKFEIYVHIGITFAFKEQYRKVISKNKFHRFSYIFGTLNMADALYRVNGIRIRVKEVADYELLDDSVLDSVIFLTFDGISNDDHRIRRCGTGIAAKWNQFRRDRQMMALDVAHSIGHQLGLEDHPHNRCGCVTRQGLCFMYEKMKARGFVWSACDAGQLKNLTNSCHRFVKVMEVQVRNHRISIIILTVIIVVELIFMLLLIIGSYAGLIHPFI